MDIKALITGHIKKYSFYKLMHDLEKIGCQGPDALSIRPLPAKIFPARDVFDIYLNGHEGSEREKAEVIAWFGGLYGVDSPLPMYFDDIIDEDTPTGRNLLNLLTLVGERYYHLLYELWSRTEPMYCDEKSLESIIRKPVLSICGLGNLDRTRINMLPLAAYLVQGLRNSWGLKAMFSYYLELPVDVREFEKARIELSDREKTRLGDPDTSVLGKNFRATPYRETFSTHIRVICGPMVDSEYVSMLPGGEKYSKMVYLAYRYLPTDIEYFLELVLHPESTGRVRFRLGENRARLGATTVLGEGKPGKTLRIVRDGVSPSTDPDELNRVIDLIEADGEPWSAITAELVN